MSPVADQPQASTCEPSPIEDPMQVSLCKLNSVIEQFDRTLFNLEARVQSDETSVPAENPEANEVKSGVAVPTVDKPESESGIVSDYQPVSVSEWINRKQRNNDLFHAAKMTKNVTPTDTYFEVKSVLDKLDVLAKDLGLSAIDRFELFEIKVPDQVNRSHQVRSSAPQTIELYQSMVKRYLSALKTTAPARNPHNKRMCTIHHSSKFQEYYDDFKQSMFLADAKFSSDPVSTEIFISGLKKTFQNRIQFISFASVEEVFHHCIMLIGSGELKDV